MPALSRQDFARALALPFDLMSAQYACAVQAGVFRRSMLASGRLERGLHLVERLFLGPWARQA